MPAGVTSIRVTVTENMKEPVQRHSHLMESAANEAIINAGYYVGPAGRTVQLAGKVAADPVSWPGSRAPTMTPV
jgi:hypothetical protein